VTSDSVPDTGTTAAAEDISKPETPPAAGASVTDSPDVFVSYAHGDRPFVVKLVRALEQAGCKVWWDTELTPGDAFSPVIQKSLEQARCVIVVWSKAALNSRWVPDEAGVGLKRGVLVPVRIEGVEPPLGFRQVHDVDFTDWRGDAAAPQVQALVGGIRKLLKDRTLTDVAPSPSRRSRWPLWAAGAALLAAIAAIAFYLQGPRPDFRIYDGYGVFDATSDVHTDKTFEECRALCRANSECSAFSYVTRNKGCFLTKTYGDMRAEQGFRSGIRTSLAQPKLDAIKP
jgi:TIR domain/PAN domain